MRRPEIPRATRGCDDAGVTGGLIGRLRAFLFEGGAPDYELPDPQLRAYDHGLGKLLVDGELKGYLASVLLTLLDGRPWPWFVVVWADGRKERSFEDYGPAWCTVSELEAGYFDGFGPSVTRTAHFLGRTFESATSGDPQRFDFMRLPPDEASALWLELGLSDEDF